MPDSFGDKPCDHPGCRLRVSIGTGYCCAECRWSHEAIMTGMAPFDPHHSQRCNERQLERDARPSEPPIRGTFVEPGKDAGC